MTGLLGPDGKPISSAGFQNKKEKPPGLGERYGTWAGEQYSMMSLPGGGAIAFDTSQLTLADFRQMRGHYQINSSLSVLTFMMHQMDWHIECKDKKVAALVENQLRNVWSRLVRSMSQALWAGYAPNVLQWENDFTGREVVLTKIKDLIPEDCRVNWKEIRTSHGKNQTTTHHVYDGIKQWGAPMTIPVSNSYWYPLLMENGNYYGRRILESAFQPWFFSTLMHLFANRYYERFGEPTPVGRAPFEDSIAVNGTSVPGNKLMEVLLSQIRNRSTVVLPNEKTQHGDEATLDYDYQIEYLESQMRGADFERYMTRLDEEMSLAMFTPLLMLRTADVGSYNLGTQHTQVYQWMLNAISGDWAHYIEKYIIAPIIKYNFNGRPVQAKMKFTKMGKTSAQLLQTILSQLASSGQIKFDARELGEMSGLTIEEVEQVTEEPAAPAPEEEPNPSEEDQKNEIKRLIVKRVATQVDKSFRNGTFGELGFSVNMGYQRRLVEEVRASRIDGASDRVGDLFTAMDEWVARTSAFGTSEYETPDEYMRAFEAKLSSMFATFLER